MTSNYSEIEGGASPVKARQSSRGGKRAGRATKTAKRRGGFAKSKGKRGGGGRNVGGYNVQTRFQPRKTQPTGGIEDLGKGGGGGGEKPVSFDKMGNMVFSPTIINNLTGGTDTKADAKAKAEVDVSTTNDRTWVPDEYGEREVSGRLPTYKESWDSDAFTVKDGYRVDKYGHKYKDDISGYEEYEKAAKKWNRENGTKSGGTRTERYLIKAGHWIDNPSSTNIKVNATADANANSPANYLGKHKLGGYRAMHGVSAVKEASENNSEDNGEEEKKEEKKGNLAAEMIQGGLNAVYGPIDKEDKKDDKKEEKKDDKEINSEDEGTSLLQKLLGGVFKKKDKEKK